MNDKALHRSPGLFVSAIVSISGMNLMNVVTDSQNPTKAVIMNK